MKTYDLPMVAAKRYKRLVWWVDVNDLTQEAWPVVLRAKQTFDPSVGVPEQAYLWRAAVVHLKQYIWRMSSPVYFPTGKLEEARGVRGESLHLHRETSIRFDVNQETLTIHNELTNLVQREVRRTIMRQEQGELAADVFIEGYTVKEVCARREVESGAVLSALKRAKTALINNLFLQRLWREER